jgi:osmotically-inducible protein OsmY
MHADSLSLLLREAFAREEGELGVAVEVQRRAVLLTGTVPSEERRSRLEDVAQRVCSAYQVVNEIRVRPLQVERGLHGS